MYKQNEHLGTTVLAYMLILMDVIIHSRRHPHLSFYKKLFSSKSDTNVGNQGFERVVNVIILGLPEGSRHLLYLRAYMKFLFSPRLDDRIKM